MSRASVLRLALLSLIWGSSFAFIKLGLEGLTPAQIVLARLSLGVAVLLLVAAVRRVRLPARDAWPHLLVLGVVGAALPYFLFGWAEQRIPSALAGLLNGATPLCTAVLAAAFLPSDRLTARRGTGLVVGFLGVLLVVGPDAVISGFTGASVAGQLAALAAAGCYGIGLVYSRRIPALQRLGALPLAAGQLTAAVLALGVAVPVWATGSPRLTVPVVLGIAALGVLGTGVAYLLFFRVLVDEGATTASLVTYVAPVIAVVIGVVVLDEPLTWNLVVGALVVIGGVALMEGRVGPAKRSAPLHAEVD